MPEQPYKNVYNLTAEQIESLDAAENLMEMHDLNASEEILLKMLEEDSLCVPVLNNLGVLYGKHFCEFEKAIDYYSKVLEIEPDNAWARDERRRYQRYASYD